MTSSATSRDWSACGHLSWRRERGLLIKIVVLCTTIHLIQMVAVVAVVKCNHWCLLNVFTCFDDNSIFLLKWMNESAKMRRIFTWKKEKRGKIWKFLSINTNLRIILTVLFEFIVFWSFFGSWNAMNSNSISRDTYLPYGETVAFQEPKNGVVVQ